MAPYHDREMAVLKRGQRHDWLDARLPESTLLTRLPAGVFRAKLLQPGDHFREALAP